MLFIIILFGLTGCLEWLYPTSKTIHFDIDGADQIISSRDNVRVGDIIDNIPELTREGYTFLGWYMRYGNYSIEINFPYTMHSNSKDWFHAVFIPKGAVIFNGIILNPNTNKTDADDEIYYEAIGLYPRKDHLWWTLILPNDYNGIPLRVIRSSNEFEMSFLTDFWNGNIHSLEVPENIIKIYDYTFGRNRTSPRLRKVFLANPEIIIGQYSFEHPNQNRVKIFFDYDEFINYTW